MIHSTASKYAPEIESSYPESDEDTFQSRKAKRQQTTKSKSKIFLSQSVHYDDERKTLISHFVRYAMRALSIRENYTIYIVDDRRRYGIKTTADYVENDNSIFIYAKGRAFVDVLRSIAHEFVHAKQHEFGIKFGHNFLHFNNDLEDEANALAGEIINAYSEVMGHNKIYEN